MTSRFPQGLPLEKRGDSVYHPDRIYAPQGTITFLWAASLTAINNEERRPSLVVQVVKNLPAKEAGVDPWSGKHPLAAEQLSPYSTTIEPTCCNYWSPCVLEPVLCIENRLQWEAHTPQLGSSPPLATTTEKRVQQGGPSTANKFKKI